MAQVSAAKKEQQARERKLKHWKGRYRYLKYEDGQYVKHPDIVGSPHWTDPEHNLIRQICTGMDEAGNLIWQQVPDAPEPPKGYKAPTNHLPDEKHLIAVAPPFDYKVPVYNSDTHSGGPSNFHGNAGGANNPRNPLAEGEVGGEYNQALKDFQEQIAGVQS